MKNLPEDSFVKYRDLCNISTRDNGEIFVSLNNSPISFGYNPLSADMQKLLGNKILVRKTVYKMLLKAQNLLKQKNGELSLMITYGYRDNAIQTKRFLLQLQDLSKTFFPDPVDLYEQVHTRVAVPTVAGHPTGGAVDVVIINSNSKKILDFGALQYEYSNKNYYAFAKGISNQAKANRQLLRGCMTSVGFAPYDGEWWHFSYGDKEWANWYKKPYAIYGQKLLLSGVKEAK